MSSKPSIEVLIAPFVIVWSQIQETKARLEALEAKASEYGEDIIKAHGVGPHSFRAKNKEGQDRVQVVRFQRVAKAVRFATTDVTDLLNPPASPSTAPQGTPPADPTAVTPPPDPTASTAPADAMNRIAAATG